MNRKHPFMVYTALTLAARDHVAFHYTGIFPEHENVVSSLECRVIKTIKHVHYTKKSCLQLGKF